MTVAITYNTLVTHDEELIGKYTGKAHLEGVPDGQREKEQDYHIANREAIINVLHGNGFLTARKTIVMGAQTRQFNDLNGELIHLDTDLPMQVRIRDYKVVIQGYTGNGVIGKNWDPTKFSAPLTISLASPVYVCLRLINDDSGNLLHGTCELVQRAAAPDPLDPDSREVSVAKVIHTGTAITTIDNSIKDSLINVETLAKKIATLETTVNNLINNPPPPIPTGSDPILQRDLAKTLWLTSLNLSGDVPTFEKSILDLLNDDSQIASVSPAGDAIFTRGRVVIEKNALVTTISKTVSGTPSDVALFVDDEAVSSSVTAEVSRDGATWKAATLNDVTSISTGAGSGNACRIRFKGNEDAINVRPVPYTLGLSCKDFCFDDAGNLWSICKDSPTTMKLMKVNLTTLVVTLVRTFAVYDGDLTDIYLPTARQRGNIFFRAGWLYFMSGPVAGGAYNHPYQCIGRYQIGTDTYEQYFQQRRYSYGTMAYDAINDRVWCYDDGLLIRFGMAPTNPPYDTYDGFRGNEVYPSTMRVSGDGQYLIYTSYYEPNKLYRMPNAITNNYTVQNQLELVSLGVGREIKGLAVRGTGTQAIYSDLYNTSETLKGIDVSTIPASPVWAGGDVAGMTLDNNGGGVFADAGQVVVGVNRSLESYNIFGPNGESIGGSRINQYLACFITS